MNGSFPLRVSPAWALAALFALPPALAQTPPAVAGGATPPAAAASAARCDGVQQDKAACQREAGAARQEAARGGLTSGTPGGNQANALERCQQLPAADKADCEARMRGGEGSSTSGSVMGGGVIRETVTTVPAPAPASAPAPAK